MKISDFTRKELDFFRQECNFVNLEVDVFEQRSRGYSLEQIAEALYISPEYARKISVKVNRKIKKAQNI